MPATPSIEPHELARLAHAYLDAEYRWALDGDWHDVRIGLPMPALELLYPRALSFGLLSAWNPCSQRDDEASNRRQDEALELLLTERDLGHLPAFSSATNRSWREPGWVILDITADELDHLAGRFGQLGALWWLRGEAVRLRMYSARPAGFEREDMVDWLE